MPQLFIQGYVFRLRVLQLRNGHYINSTDLITNVSSSASSDNQVHSKNYDSKPLCRKVSPSCHNSLFYIQNSLSFGLLRDGCRVISTQRTISGGALVMRNISEASHFNGYYITTTNIGPSSTDPIRWVLETMNDPASAEMITKQPMGSPVSLANGNSLKWNIVGASQWYIVYYKRCVEKASIIILPLLIHKLTV